MMSNRHSGELEGDRAMVVNLGILEPMVMLPTIPRPWARRLRLPQLSLNPPQTGSLYFAT